MADKHKMARDFATEAHGSDTVKSKQEVPTILALTPASTLADAAEAFRMDIDVFADETQGQELGKRPRVVNWDDIVEETANSLQLIIEKMGGSPIMDVEFEIEPQESKYGVAGEGVEYWGVEANGKLIITLSDEYGSKSVEGVRMDNLVELLGSSLPEHVDAYNKTLTDELNEQRLIEQERREAMAKAKRSLKEAQRANDPMKTPKDPQPSLRAQPATEPPKPKAKKSLWQKLFG